jgi:hypothetical protein
MARTASAYLMTIKLNKEGNPYQHYLKDKKGQRILRENATPEQLALAKNADPVSPNVGSTSVSSKSQSEWLMVKKQARSGKVYQHYLKDAKGQRILRATATQEQLAMTTKIQTAKTTERSAARVKSTNKKLNKLINASAKRHKIPVDIKNLLVKNFDNQKIGKCSMLCGEYCDKSSDWRPIEFNASADWLLIHFSAKKGQNSYVEEYYFYNPYNEDWVAFDIDAYLALPKPRTINWPAKSVKVLEAEPIPETKKAKKSSVK